MEITSGHLVAGCIGFVAGVIVGVIGFAMWISWLTSSGDPDD